tara:strand:- start:644 stop:931 length:288 start_codon:yes stop_codon:yes gene_type:complete
VIVNVILQAAVIVQQDTHPEVLAVMIRLGQIVVRQVMTVVKVLILVVIHQMTIAQNVSLVIVIVITLPAAMMATTTATAKDSQYEIQPTTDLSVE